MPIKCVTFKTNQTVLGDITENGDTVTIVEPVQVVSVPQRAANEAPQLAFSPFLDYTEEFKKGIVFKRTDILTITEPVIELRNQYNTIFGAGIQIASHL